MQEKPQWMSDHEKEDGRRFDEMTGLLRELNETLKPIAETYRAASLVGKWSMGVLVFISVLLGVIFSLKSFLVK